MSSEAKPLRLRAIITEGPHKGFDKSFLSFPITIGRTIDNTLPLVKDPKVSRAHAVITMTKVGPLIQKISPKNTLIINGQDLATHPIGNQTIVIVGDTKINFMYTIDNNDHVGQGGKLLSLKNSGRPARKQNKISTNNMNRKAFPIRPPEFEYETEDDGYDSPAPFARSTGTKSSPILIVTVIALAVGAFLYLSPDGIKKSKGLKLKSTQERLKELEKSKANLEKIQTQQQSQGPQFDQAQTFYIKGFRDYRQGQYGRAIDAFRATLAFYPDHALARRYLLLAQKKYDEFISFNLQQGHRYREKNNYRLCESAFNNVLVMVKDQTDPKFKEAQQYRDECSALSEGRY